MVEEKHAETPTITTRRSILATEVRDSLIENTRSSLMIAV
jgi:hypothetical protein